MNLTNNIDMMKLGIITRKLTRKEAATITKEVMDMALKDPNARFMMVILKTIEVTNR